MGIKSARCHVKPFAKLAIEVSSVGVSSCPRNLGDAHVTFCQEDDSPKDPQGSYLDDEFVA